MRSKTSRYQGLGARILLIVLLLASVAWAGSKAPQAASNNTNLAAALKSGQPVIAKLGADWCPPCRAMKPELKALAAEQQGKIVVLDLDIDQNRQLAREYKVNLIPTTLFYSKSGQFKDKKTGFMSKTELLAKARELGLVK
ncbi:MAG: thioredoxin family protein [Candidatus Margulisiibacteriota bacterium]